LLEVDADAAAAAILTHRGDIGGFTGELRQLDCIRKAPHAPTRQEPRHGNLAGLSPEFMPVFNLSDPLELPELRVELGAVRNDRQIEHAAAQRPGAQIPFGGCAERIAPGFRGVVEGAGIDDRPVQKIAARVVRVLVGIEDIGNAEFSDSEDQSVGRLAGCKLIDAGINLLRLAAIVCRTKARCRRV